MERNILKAKFSGRIALGRNALGRTILRAARKLRPSTILFLAAKRLQKKKLRAKWGLPTGS